MATYGKQPSELTKDLTDVGTLADAYGRGLDASPDIAMAQLTQYPVDLRLVAAVEEKYGAFMCAEREKNDGPGPMERRTKQAKQAMMSFRGDLELRAVKSVSELSERLGMAEQLMKAYKAKSTSYDEKKRSLLGDSASDVRESMRGAEVVLRALEITRGKSHPDTLKARRQLEATSATLNRINDEIALNNVEATALPIDAYNGADKASLKTAVKTDWGNRFPTDQVLGVFVTGKQWNRKSGVYFRERDNRVVQYDNSFLQVSVVVKVDDNIADVWVYDVRRDHLEADNLKMDYALTRAKVSKVLARKVK